MKIIKELVWRPCLLFYTLLNLNISFLLYFISFFSLYQRETLMRKIIYKKLVILKKGEYFMVYHRIIFLVPITRNRFSKFGLYYPVSSEQEHPKPDPYKYSVFLSDQVFGFPCYISLSRALKRNFFFFSFF